MNKISILMFAVGMLLLASCRPTKQVITSVISPKDTTANITDTSSLLQQQLTKDVKAKLASNFIDFKTFSAKIKVETQDGNGKNPDITAVVKIVKDSAMWISLTATLLNVEVYRIYLTPDSVIMLDKRAKTYQVRTINFLSEVTKIPFDFRTLQNLLVGNPIFYDESNATVKRIDNAVLVNSFTTEFKNLMTLSADNFQLQKIKLDDRDEFNNRTADIVYADYEQTGGVNFSNYRDISVAEKTRIQAQLKFKQHEFNKELQITFSIPKNYKRK